MSRRHCIPRSLSTKPDSGTRPAQPGRDHLALHRERADPYDRLGENRSGLLAADWYGQLVADLADLSPDRYAPLIATVLERLTFAVVRMPVPRAAGGPAPGAAPAGAMRMFAQLRTALAARTVTAAGIAAVYRYRDPDEVRGDLDELRAAGLICAAGDGAIEAT